MDKKLHKIAKEVKEVEKEDKHRDKAVKRGEACKMSCSGMKGAKGMKKKK